MFGYPEVWAVDFEFNAPPGERPNVVCLVALELNSGRLVRRWRDELDAGPPYPVESPNAVFLAYYASAEWGCHLALGWSLPRNVIDLYAEFRNLTNGLPVPSGNGLLGALRWFGLDVMAASEKKDMRDLILSGGPWPTTQKRRILDYCERDVRALEILVPRMERHIDRVPEALQRGRYTKAAARMEYCGVPVDTEVLGRLNLHWDDVRIRLVEHVDQDFGVYDGLTFKLDKFTDYLATQGIPWLRLPSGELDLKDETFRQAAKVYPEIAPLHQLRHAMSQLKLQRLTVGRDGRNRTLLSPFGSKSGRNTPSNTCSVFGPSAWVRSLIQPKPGRAVAYVDWCQQELGIAAALSGDENMRRAYMSGDFYLTFAKQAGAAPESATKHSHARERELFKTCSLGVLYGMGPETMARRIGEPVAKARQLLQLHRETYRVFWNWSDGAVAHFNVYGELWTVYGWHLRGEAREPALRNFPMQANGAEMLRLACCYLTEAGVDVCMPIHDAVLVEGPILEIDRIVDLTRRLMEKASMDVLGGFELRTDVDIFRHPDRYQDKRGISMWETVMELLNCVSNPMRPPCCEAGNSVL